MQPVHCPRCGHSVRVKRLQVLAAAPVQIPVRPVIQAPVPPEAASGAGELQAGDDDDGKTYVRDDRGCLVLAEWTEDGRLIPARSSAAAIPAQPQTTDITWAGALAVLGWVLDPFGGACQIVASDGLCDAEATRHITGGWVCPPHYSALCSVINRGP